MRQFVRVLVLSCFLSVICGAYLKLNAQTVPVAVNDSFTLCNNVNQVFDVLANDNDFDGDSIYLSSILSSPLHGTANQFGNVIFFTPDTAYVGPDTLSYIMCDIDTAGGCDTAFVYMNIDSCPAPANNPPTPEFDIFVGFEDFPIVLDFLDNDSDPDGDALTATVLFGPFFGTTFDGGGFTNYKGNANYNGFDFVVYQVCDDGSPSLCNFSFAVINIQAVNDEPVARKDTFYILEDEIVDLDVLANDTDVDGDALTAQVDEQPLRGNVVETDSTTLTYRSLANYVGEDFFFYEACDGSDCKRARVQLYISPVNDAPIAVDDAADANLEGVATLNVLDNDFDIEGDELFYTINTPPTNGIVFTDPDGTVEYRVEGSYFGIDSFEYVLCDATLCDEAWVYIHVPPLSLNEYLVEGFSPNSDGYNDFLEIGPADVYNNVSLKVFNRWGDMVYESNDYQNNWDGTDMISGKPLPVGTYYYIVNVPELGEAVQYIELRR